MEVPSKYKTAGTLMLISGIINILSGLVLGLILFLYITGIAISTFGIGIVCYVCCLWPIIPMGFGIFEVVTGMKISNGTPVPNASNVAIGGVILAALNLGSGLGIVSLILEIIAFINLNDPESKRYVEAHTADLLT